MAKSNKLPNIRGQHYRIGKLALTKVPTCNISHMRPGDGTRLGPEVGFVLFIIPRTTWVAWWVRN